MQQDIIQRFLIERANVRGQLVRLNKTWLDMTACADYPQNISQLLGQASTATMLLASTLKFDGTLTLQVNGEGPITLVNVQATSQNTLRGLIRWGGEVSGSDLSTVCGVDQLSLTVSMNKGKGSYQGVVLLQGDDLGKCLEHYLWTSEQLPTRLWLETSEDCVAGLLLQQLPTRSEKKMSVEEETEGWERVQMLTDTISADELLNQDSIELLRKLYALEEVRVYKPADVRFKCACSRERVESILLSLGLEECAAAIKQEGRVHVTCEYCNSQQVFQEEDIHHIFGIMPDSDEGSASLH